MPQLPDSWNQFLLNNPIVVLIGLLLGVVGVIGLILTFVYRQTKKICYLKLTNNIIHGNVSKMPLLDIRYNKKPVTNLTVTRLVIWNGGTLPVRERDIPTGSSLSVAAVNACRILDAAVTHISNDANNIKALAVEDSKLAKLQFEFMGSGDWIEIQVLHTGQSDSDIEFRGSIIGGKLARYLVDLRATVRIALSYILALPLVLVLLTLVKGIALASWLRTLIQMILLLGWFFAGFIHAGGAWAIANHLPGLYRGRPLLSEAKERELRRGVE